MAKFAAALLEAHEDDLVFQYGMISVKGSPASGKSFAEVAAFAYRPVPLPKGLEPGLSDEAFFEPSNNTYPFGCHIVVMEIDRETGEPTLTKLIAGIACARRAHPRSLRAHRERVRRSTASGRDDPMVERAEYERMRHQLWNCTFVTISGAGHGMTAEIPDRCAEVLKTFIESIDTR